MNYRGKEVEFFLEAFGGKDGIELSVAGNPELVMITCCEVLVKVIKKEAASKKASIKIADVLFEKVKELLLSDEKPKSPNLNKNSFDYASICMPLAKNVRNPKPGWTLTKCPKCGRDCYMMDFMKDVVLEGAEFMCTECALKGGVKF